MLAFPRSLRYSLLLGAILASTAIAQQRERAQPLKSLRVLTYNIHHAEGVDGRLDVPRIAEVIRAAKPDVVALQEVDRRVERSQSVDQAAELASLLHMHAAFGDNIQLEGGEYGNAVLSRYPIRRRQNHALPRFDDSEQRGVLQTEIALPDGQTLHFLVTHFDHRREDRERQASAKQVNELYDRILKTSKAEPVLAILAGDMNATPNSEPMKILGERWKVSNPQAMPTIPVDQPQRQIDFVLLGRDSQLQASQTQVLDESIASDHRPLLAVVQLPEPREKQAAVPPISKVLFGSCIQQDQAMPILETMRAEQPQLMLFMGDNIYADTADINLMREKYDQLGANDSFQAFRGSCRQLATWDDHDYGANDGGSDFAVREAAQQVFLDFWKEPADSPRRSRAGVYDATVLGPPGKRLQVILLDTRYFRSPLKTGPRRVGGAYVPDHDRSKTMLGEAQWKWLETQLQQPAEVRLLVSSIQCLPSDAGQETWANLPHERQRLFELLQTTQAAGVVIVSGDRHWAELSQVTEGVPYPLFEMTSSSLNQIHPRGTPTENLHRAQPTTYHRENYGCLQIDWQREDPTLLIEVRDLDGKTQIGQQLQLSQLQPR